MARTEHLPIYKAAYDLCLWLEQVVRGCGRYHKYAIGSELREGSRRILRLVGSVPGSVSPLDVSPLVGSDPVSGQALRFWMLAHSSLRVAVRLITTAPGRESGSTQK